MNGYSGTKINQLLKIWPKVTGASTSWLESQGVYHQLAADYERHSWLKPIGHGAFIKAGDEVDWQVLSMLFKNTFNFRFMQEERPLLDYMGIHIFCPWEKET